MTSNWMELGLSRDEEEFVRRSAELYKAVYIETIDTVFDLAKAIEILRRAHHNSGVQSGFADALVQYGFTARDGGPMNKAIRSHLKALHENEQAVRAWWASVPARTKRDWLSAKAIYTHWNASLKPKNTAAAAPVQRPSEPSASASKPPDSASALAQAKARNVELEQTLAQAKARIAELERQVALAQMASGKVPKTVAELRAQMQVADEMRKAERAAAKAARPAKAPPVDAAETLETMAEKLRQKDQQLKAARTRIHNLNVEVDVLKGRKKIPVSKALLRAMRGYMHPDRAPTDPKERRRLEQLSQEFNSFTWVTTDDGG
jgi:hypothetical protein